MTKVGLEGYVSGVSSQGLVSLEVLRVLCACSETYFQPLSSQTSPLATAQPQRPQRTVWGDRRKYNFGVMGQTALDIDVQELVVISAFHRETGNAIARHSSKSLRLSPNQHIRASVDATLLLVSDLTDERRRLRNRNAHFNLEAHTVFKCPQSRRVGVRHLSMACGS